MIITINPKRLNVSGGTTGRSGDQPRPALESPVYVAPARAHINFIPGPDSLATLVASAVEALRRGVRWDRGTILNLLV